MRPEIAEMHADLRRLSNRVRELEYQLAEAANGRLPEDQRLEPDLFTAGSIVSAATGEPFVMLRWFTHVAQVPPETAQKIAYDILGAVEAAQSDAFLISFLRRANFTTEDMGKLLIAFRDYRAERDKQKADDAEVAERKRLAQED